MKRDGRHQPQDRRREILEAAARAIAEHGYYGMSMRALAKATGKSLATAYNYFSSKEEILFALQKEAFETLIGAADRALAGVEPAGSRLYVFILNHISYFTAHAEVMRVLIHEAGSLPPAKRRAIRKLKRDYFEIGREVIARLLKEGGDPADAAEIERVSYSLFGMLNWIYSWYEPDRHGGAQDLARTMHQLVLCGAVTSCPATGARNGMDRHFEKIESPPLLGGAAVGRPTREEASR